MGGDDDRRPAGDGHERWSPTWSLTTTAAYLPPLLGSLRQASQSNSLRPARLSRAAESLLEDIDKDTAQALARVINEWVKADFPVRGRVTTLAGETCMVNLGQAHGLVVVKGAQEDVGRGQPQAEGGHGPAAARRPQGRDGPGK